MTDRHSSANATTFRRTFIAATLATFGAGVGFGGPAVAQSLSDVEAESSDQTARDALLAERNRQDNFQSAVEEMASLSQDAQKMEQDEVLDANREVKFGNIPNGEARVARIADALPQDYENQEAVDADVPDGMTFGTEEWVKYKISDDVSGYFAAQDVRGLEGLRSMCDMSSGYREKLNNQGVIGGTSAANCSGITEDEKEKAHEIQVSFAAEQNMNALSDTLASSFGVEDPGTIGETVDNAIAAAEKTDQEIKSVVSNDMKAKHKSVTRSGLSRVNKNTAFSSNCDVDASASWPSYPSATAVAKANAPARYDGDYKIEILDSGSVKTDSDSNRNSCSGTDGTFKSYDEKEKTRYGVKARYIPTSGIDMNITDK